jgi:hypothetical protein
MLSSVTRYPGGLANVVEGSLFGDLKQPSPTKYHVFFDDFDRYTAGDWVVTETDAGATQALVGADGGQLVITNTAGITDVVELRWAGGSGAFLGNFTFDPAKDLFVAAKFKLDNASLPTALIGLRSSNSTNTVALIKAGGAATLLARVQSSTGTVSTTVAGAAMVADTFVVAGLAYTAADGKMTFFQDDAASPVTGWVAPAAATLMAPNIGMVNTTAVARVMTLDWVFFAKQR